MAKCLDFVVHNEKISEDLIKYVENRKGHDRRYAIDPSKIKKELGWEPQVKFEDGIKKTVKWYVENRKWVLNLVLKVILKVEVDVKLKEKFYE